MILIMIDTSVSQDSVSEEVAICAMDENNHVDRSLNFVMDLGDDVQISITIILTTSAKAR